MIDNTLKSTYGRRQDSDPRQMIVTQKNPDGTTTIWKHGRMTTIPSGEPYTDREITQIWRPAVPLTAEELAILAEGEYQL